MPAPQDATKTGNARYRASRPAALEVRLPAVVDTPSSPIRSSPRSPLRQSRVHPLVWVVCLAVLQLVDLCTGWGSRATGRSSPSPGVLQGGAGDSIQRRALAVDTGISAAQEAHAECAARFAARPAAPDNTGGRLPAASLPPQNTP